MTIQRQIDEERWVLEVTSRDGQVTGWDDDFSSEQEALQEFLEVIQTEGIAAFV